MLYLGNVASVNVCVMNSISFTFGLCVFYIQYYLLIHNSGVKLKISSMYAGMLCTMCAIFPQKYIAFGRFVKLL